jgi:hypothetical protein
MCDTNEDDHDTFTYVQHAGHGGGYADGDSENCSSMRSALRHSVRTMKSRECSFPASMWPLHQMSNCAQPSHMRHDMRRYIKARTTTATASQHTCSDVYCRKCIAKYCFRCIIVNVAAQMHTDTDTDTDRETYTTVSTCVEHEASGRRRAFYQQCAETAAAAASFAGPTQCLPAARA